MGLHYTHCRESRQSAIGQPSAETQVKISDGQLFYETGALADGVTVTDADFDQGSIDLGMKFKGLHLQAEYYFRNLSKFNAQGPTAELSTIPIQFSITDFMQLPLMKLFHLRYNCILLLPGYSINSKDILGKL